MKVHEITTGIWRYTWHRGMGDGWGIVMFDNKLKSTGPTLYPQALTYSPVAQYSWSEDFTEATEEEKRWLLACMGAGKYVPPDQVHQTYEIY